MIWGQPTSTGPPGCLAELEIGCVANVAVNNEAAVQPLCAGLISGKGFTSGGKKTLSQPLSPQWGLCCLMRVFGCGAQGPGELGLGEFLG